MLTIRRACWRHGRAAWGHRAAWGAAPGAPGARPRFRAAARPLDGRSLVTYRKMESDKTVDLERQRDDEAAAAAAAGEDRADRDDAGAAAPPPAAPAATAATAASAASAAPAAAPSDGIDRRVYPIAASALLMGSAIGVVMPVMPLFAADIGLSERDFGLVVSVMGVTRLLFNVPAAWAADRFGRRPLLFGGPVLSAVGMGMTGTAASLEALAGWRFLTAAGGSFQMSGAQLYLTDISSAHNRARTIAPMMAAFSAGTAMGPAAGGYLAEHFGLAAPFHVVGGLICVVALSNWALLPETLRRRPPGTGAGAGGAGGPGDGAERRPLSTFESLRQSVALWGPLSREGPVRAALVLHGCYWTTTAGVQFTLLPLLAAGSFDMGPSALGSLYAMMSVINVLGSQPAAWVSDRLGRRVSIFSGGALLAAAAACLPQAATPEAFHGLVALYSIGSTLLGTAPTAYLADITDERTRASALAMQRSCGDAGMMVGASVGGALASATSSAFAVPCLASVMGMGMAYFAARARVGEEAARAVAAAVAGKGPPRGGAGGPGP